MKNLLVITQKVDENNDLLGFFVAWLREFSKHFDKVFVITLAKGRYELPDNVFVYSLGKERGSNRISRVFNFYALLFKLVPKTQGVFAHMSPVFAIASWPVAMTFRKKIILWYLHRSLTLRLKIAEKVCFKILTADKDSLTLKSKKIIETGHGIEVERFRINRSISRIKPIGPIGPIRILTVGRISKIKNYETLIKAAKILKDRGLEFRTKIVGQPVMPYDFEYFEELKKLVNNLGLKDLIEFAGFVPYSRIANYYKESDIFVNMAPMGGIDKVVLEAMASGSLVLVSNEAFRKYLGGYDLFFRHGDSESLAESIFRLINFSPKEIETVSNFLVDSVKKSHDLENMINKISNFFFS